MSLHPNSSVDGAEQSTALHDGAAELLRVADSSGERYTHRLFRYPAKFHPPVVRALLDRYTVVGERILDTFCGSGTLMIEAAVSGRPSVGLDLDPVAVEVAKAKTRLYNYERLADKAYSLVTSLGALERSAAEYEKRKFRDLSPTAYESTLRADGLWVPNIPAPEHWFRRYVLVDLAWILRTINALDCSTEERLFFRVVFAAIIRSASNADPVPVSGLEVTSHMKRKDAAGRVINPFQLYISGLKKRLHGVKELMTAYQTNGAAIPLCCTGDATELPAEFEGEFGSIVTSPPYHNAVDYYRRHQLEMYWLGLVQDHEDRLGILPKYIGRHRVPMKHPLLQESWQPAHLARKWEDEIRAVSEQRANDFRVYCIWRQCLRSFVKCIA